jgi:hypothetical protein
MGTWTSDYCGGGNFYICEDPATRIVQGVYSEIGFVYGNVSVINGARRFFKISFVLFCFWFFLSLITIL